MVSRDTNHPKGPAGFMPPDRSSLRGVHGGHISHVPPWSETPLGPRGSFGSQLVGLEESYDSLAEPYDSCP